jgi:Holliday junction resolvase
MDWFHGARAERLLANRFRGVGFARVRASREWQGASMQSEGGGVPYLHFFTGATQWKAGCYE